MNTSDVDMLLVDSSQHDVDMVLHTLRRGSFASNSSFVREGREALDFIFCRGEFAERTTRNLPKLILLDLNLPDCSGIEVLRKLKSDPRSRTTPVVVMIPDGDGEFLDDVYRNGANGCILKSTDGEVFRLVLKRLGNYWLKVNHPPSHDAALKLLGAR